MNYSQALVPSLLSQHFPNAHTSSVRSGSWIINALTILTGSLMIALAAQVAIPLPFTPVPITGQTFGVLLIGLTFGRTRAVLSVATYLTAGLLGAPVFASAGLLAPSSGYLLGMLVSAFCVGTLADRGWSRHWATAFAACFVSSIAIFACGLTVLGYFVGYDQVISLGLLPFIPGDLVKMTLAVSLVKPMHKFLANS